MDLNNRAAALARRFIEDGRSLRVEVCAIGGACVVDAGVRARGGLEAGRRMAEICLAGLGQVQIAAPDRELGPWPTVQCHTDHPVAACMASQYAGWQLTHGDFFAMGSGPMRAAAAKEDLFDKIGHRESPEKAVGTLEAGQLPPAEICRAVADDCGVDCGNLTLFVAPTASQAGAVQVVARSVETALHKMLELGFDIRRVESGFGAAPLPPVAADAVAAIGRTNDAILYGAHVTLWLRGDDASLQEIGPRVPSSASSDYGAPFAEIFEHYNRDFYQIDPQLFSPAVVLLNNLDTGRSFRFGEIEPAVVRKSFVE